jgi:hypothetical protein
VFPFLCCVPSLQSSFRLPFLHFSSFRSSFNPSPPPLPPPLRSLVNRHVLSLTRRHTTQNGIGFRILYNTYKWYLYVITY